MTAEVNEMFMDTPRGDRAVPCVRLRAMEPEDLDFLYEVENDQRIWNVGLTNVPYSRNLLLDYIASSTGDIFADKQVRLMIENERGLTVGMVDLINFSPAHCRAELGIVIKNEFQGQGYGGASILKMMDYAKNIVHLHQIYSIVDENNKKCAEMLKRAGFQQVMRMKDWLFDGSEYHSAIFFQIFF